jgi:hypothetical protein
LVLASLEGLPNQIFSREPRSSNFAALSLPCNPTTDEQRRLSALTCPCMTSSTRRTGAISARTIPLGPSSALGRCCALHTLRCWELRQKDSSHSLRKRNTRITWVSADIARAALNLECGRDGGRWLGLGLRGVPPAGSSLGLFHRRTRIGGDANHIISGFPNRCPRKARRSGPFLCGLSPPVSPGRSLVHRYRF